MASFFRTYRVMPDGQRIDGVYLLAFIQNAGFHLTPVNIYQDGMIDCWGLVTFDEFKLKVRSGWVMTQLPPDASVSVHHLAGFKATEAHYLIEPEQLILEVADEIERLNNSPTTRDKCFAAWKAYRATPTEVSKEKLRVAYEALPRHLRRYVLSDQDNKDYPIRKNLYPGQPMY